MRAVTRYGPPDVLQLQEVANPIPKDDKFLTIVGPDINVITVWVAWKWV